MALTVIRNDNDYDDSYPIIRVNREFPFRFDSNNPYNHLRAGKWIQSEKYTDKKARGAGVVFTAIGLLFAVVIPGIILSDLLSMILPVVFTLIIKIIIIGLYIWIVVYNAKHKRNKYNLKKSVLVQAMPLMMSCNVQRGMMTCRLERSNNDTFDSISGDYTENQPIRNFSFNPDNNPNTRRWYLAFTQLKHLNMYVDTVVFIETAGDKARLLIPDNPMIGNIIAVDMLGISNHDRRILYDNGTAYFADTYNDMDADGISDDKDKRNSNSFMFDSTQTHDATMFTM